jgi:hypothetical protein
MPNPRPQSAGHDELPSANFANRPLKSSAITLGIDIVSHKFVFTMNQTQGEQSTAQSDSDGHFLFIERGQYVEFKITLDSAWDWRFDTNPISFKNRGHAPNYKLVSRQDDEIILWAKSTRPTSALPGPSDPPDNQNHEFNLYLIMTQTDLKGFPVRLDPDLKNPPPPPTLYKTTSGPVPII